MENKLVGDKGFPLVGALTVTTAVLIGLFFCIVGRENVHLFGDEILSIPNIVQPYNTLFKTYDTTGSGVPLLVIQRFAVQVFGPGLWAYRFPAFLGAIATLLIIYPAGVRLVGTDSARIATLAMSLNSMHIFYSRFARSYTLIVFLGLLMVYVFKRATNQDKSRALLFIILALSVGLLPYVHLTAAGFVIVVGVSAAFTLVLEKKLRIYGPWLISSFIAGVLICVCLYLPVWDPLWQFINLKAGQGNLSEINILEIFSLMAGNRTAAYVWLVGIPAASIWIILKKRSQAIVLVVAAVAPVVAVLLTKPYGMTYAYARYMFIGMPFMIMLLSWLLVELTRKIPLPEQSRGYISLGFGIVLIGVSFLTGPLGIKHTEDGPFANSYLSMMPLHAFDKPWDNTPAFYDFLANSPESFQIIEAPILRNRSVQLYRNYYLQHSKKVIFGFYNSKRPKLISGPYVNLAYLQSIKNSNSDYLIFHLDITREVEEYWDFVFNRVWLAMRDPEVASLMLRQKKNQIRYGKLTFIAEFLEKQLGSPIYRDQKIAVWNLRDLFKDEGAS